MKYILWEIQERFNLPLRNQMAYNPIANGVAEYFAFFNGVDEMDAAV